jgi:MFS family permease
MLLLLAGGVVGGLADSYGLVLAARVAEGLAAGVVQPIPAIIILRAFEPHEQGRASGFFGMGVVLAPAIGPSIGGRAGGPVWLALHLLHGGAVLPGVAVHGVPLRARHGARRRGGQPRRRIAGLARPAAGRVGTLCLLNGWSTARWQARTGRPALLLACAALGAGGVCGLAAPAQGHGGEPADEPGAVSATGSSPWAAWWPSSTAPRCLAPPTCCRSTCRWAAAVGLACGHHPAASGSGAGHHHRRGGPSGRPPAHLAAGEHRVWPCWRLPSPDGAVTWTTALWVLVAFAILGRIGLGFILPSLNWAAMRGWTKMR